MSIINIIGATEGLDNWGNIERYNTRETYQILIEPVLWSDDILFYDDNGARYSIEDLINKRVQCGPIIFTVCEDME
jgi:hypothetical protein